jgi:hypothetical protein
MQVTPEYVEKFIRSNCIPVGYLYTAVIISHTKRGLSEDIAPEWRLKFLDGLDRLVNHENNTWLTEEMVAAIDPVCDAGMEMISEAAKLDRGMPGRPGMLDALAKFFPAFAVLNPSLLAAFEIHSDGSANLSAQR